MTNNTQRYDNPNAFRVALEARLRNYSAKENEKLQEVRRRVSFDRLLAKLFTKETSARWILKGGYAMEMRLLEARTTRDIDFCMPIAQQQGQIIKELQSAVEVNLSDFFTFKIGESMMDLDGPPEGGGRLPVDALVANRIFTKFHIDIGIGDIVIMPTELIEGRDW